MTRWNPELYCLSLGIQIVINMNIGETFTNRYGDEFTFTPLENGDILWEGDFKYSRVGMPNDYTQAYGVYYNNECTIPHDVTLSLDDFKEAIHKEGRIRDLYREFVTANTGLIDMVDPSGGPYLSAGMDINGKTIKEFRSRKEGGYIIVVT